MRVLAVLFGRFHCLLLWLFPAVGFTFLFRLWVLLFGFLALSFVPWQGLGLVVASGLSTLLEAMMKPTSP
jgi:hypothetical protein